MKKKKISYEVHLSRRNPIAQFLSGFYLFVQKNSADILTLKLLTHDLKYSQDH